MFKKFVKWNLYVIIGLIVLGVIGKVLGVGADTKENVKQSVSTEVSNKKDSLEAEKLAREKVEKLAKEKAEAERIAKEKELLEAKIKAEKLANEKAEKLAKEKAKAKRLAKEKAEKLVKNTYFVGEMQSEYLICRKSTDLYMAITYFSMNDTKHLKKYFDGVKCFYVDEPSNFKTSKKPKIIKVLGKDVYSNDNIYGDIFLKTSDRWLKGFYINASKLKQPYTYNK